MIKINKKPTHNYILLIVIILFSINSNIVYSNSAEIQIDQMMHELIAPRGESYQWFYNGIPLTNQNQRLKATRSGEYQVIIKDQKGNESIQVIHIAVDKKGTIRKIYIIGDSTVMTYNSSYYPQMGWGQTLPLYFDNSQIQFENHAIGGRSSRSFYEQGRWTTVYNLLSPGDFVFIQFGHNDRDWSKPERYTSVDSFKYFMRLYINETRAKGAIPVLVSPMIMNAYNGTALRNVFTETGNDYRGAMLQVATELNALFVDLNMKSYYRVKELGMEYATYYLFFGLIPGEYPNYPDGHSDGTHFQEMGALEMSRLIIEGICELDTNADMAFLESILLPTHKVDVALDVPIAGIVTDSSAFPSGVNVTVKTRIKSSFTFNHWEDPSKNVVYSSNLFMLTMGDKDTSLIASTCDCNGDTAGTAYIDKCSICSGGNTNIPHCVTTYQSESACEYDGNLVDVNYDGKIRKVVNTDTFPTPSITFNVNASKDSTYEFGIIYLSNDPDEKLDVYVNEIKQIDSIEVDTNGNFQVKIIELDLIAGVNTITISSQSATGGILFDFINSYTPDITSAACPVVEIQNNQIPDMTIFPNPFNNEFIVNLEGDFEYSLYTITGIEIIHGKAREKIKLGNNWDTGVYILKICQGDKAASHILYKK